MSGYHNVVTKYLVIVVMYPNILAVTINNLLYLLFTYIHYCDSQGLGSAVTSTFGQLHGEVLRQTRLVSTLDD